MKNILKLVGISLVFAAAATGCQNAGNGTGDPADTGTLGLPLQTTGSSGTTYRLRNANFEIYGYQYYKDVGYPIPMEGVGYGAVEVAPPEDAPIGVIGTGGAGGAGGSPVGGTVSTGGVVSTGGAPPGGAPSGGVAGSYGGAPMGGMPGVTFMTVSSEEDPTAPSIAVDVERGQYNIYLESGWSLEKVVDGVAETVPAVLLSGASQYAYVSPHSTSYVSFQFGVGDRTIWLNGNLNIGVEVYENPEEYYGYGGMGGYPGTGGYPSTGGFGGVAGYPSTGGSVAVGGSVGYAGKRTY